MQASRQTFRMISIATPSSNGHSSPPMACTGAYHNVPMGALQHPGEERDTFIGLSRESSEMGRRMGIIFPEDPIEYNLKIIDKLDHQSTASMQKGHCQRP